MLVLTQKNKKQNKNYRKRKNWPEENNRLLKMKGK